MFDKSAVVHPVDEADEADRALRSYIEGLHRAHLPLNQSQSLDKNHVFKRVASRAPEQIGDAEQHRNMACTGSDQRFIDNVIRQKRRRPGAELRAENSFGYKGRLPLLIPQRVESAVAVHGSRRNG